MSEEQAEQCAAHCTEQWCRLETCAVLDGGSQEDVAADSPTPGAPPPSADPETLRARIEALESSYRANGEQRDALGKPAWPLNVARDLRAALDAR